MERFVKQADNKKFANFEGYDSSTFTIRGSLVSKLGGPTPLMPLHTILSQLPPVPIGKAVTLQA